ncbi:unnamed protein product [Brassica rapa]|uniref:Uncharacterized protein n=1 Tax=Brassica campestris TaxID=3711 RepID=A0A8D9G0J5_BRACM|nr:unnamed protein product [Brassica rapa]
MVIRSYIVAVGKEIVDLCLNSVRDLADNYTCLQGVPYNGVLLLPSLLLKSLIFPKFFKLGVAVVVH